MVTMLPLKFFAAVCFSLTMVVETVSLRCQHQFRCGKILIKVRYPLGVEGDPRGCGDPDVRLSCERNRTVLYLGPNSHKYYVAEESIHGKHESPLDSIRVIDPELQKNNCSTIPLYSNVYPFFSYSDFMLHYGDNQMLFVMVTCKKPVVAPLYVDTAPCVTAKELSNLEGAESNYSYVVVGKRASDLVASDIEETCTIHKVMYSRFQHFLIDSTRNISFKDIHDAMASGFELEYGRYFNMCKRSIPSKCIINLIVHISPQSQTDSYSSLYCDN
nr:uncharacterized protein LOC113697564 [Coffea arabica]